EPGDVIGMQMCVRGLHQLQIQIANQLQVAVHLFQHRVDDQSLSAAAGSDQIGVGARDWFEQLAEDHDCLRIEPKGANNTLNRRDRAMIFVHRTEPSSIRIGAAAAGWSRPESAAGRMPGRRPLGWPVRWVFVSASPPASLAQYQPAEATAPPGQAAAIRGPI